jgi:predicted porin
MKRNKILAAAIVAALTAPLQAAADTANVNMYGNFDVSYDSINTGTAAKGTSGTTSNRVSSNTSFIGVKGSVDASDGLSAIWQVESLINVGDAAANGTPTGATTNNGIGYLASRNTFAGLKDNSYGTVFAGRNDTPYRLSTRRFDVFDRGIADNRSIMGGSNVAAKVAFDGRQDQLVEYISPSLGGVTIAAAHINLSPTVDLGGQYQGNATSVAGWYNANGFYGTLAYEQHNLQNSTNSSYLGSEHAGKLGFGYTREGVFTVDLFAEQTSDNVGTGGANLYGHNAYYVSGKFYVGSAGAIKGAFTDASNLGGGNTANTGAKQATLGYDYSLSKRTALYALYTKLSNESAADYSLSIYNGTAASVGGTTTIAGSGASPSALAVGVLVTF